MYKINGKEYQVKPQITTRVYAAFLEAFGPVSTQIKFDSDQATYQKLLVLMLQSDCLPAICRAILTDFVQSEIEEESIPEAYRAFQDFFYPRILYLANIDPSLLASITQLQKPFPNTSDLVNESQETTNQA